VKTNRCVLFLLEVSFITFTANAQNLPNVQKESVIAPANVKIDGKVTEWDNKFQAYNKNTRIYYTVSNDGTNLYLTIQAVDYNTIKKILAGGITFTLGNTTKKKDSTAIAFTFPVYEQGQKNLAITNQWKSEPKKIDSFINVYNRQIATNLKLIEVKGLKSIANGVISIYNENGIKAAVLFDKDMNYNYELAIPLKLIAATPVEISKFNYNLQFNGLKTFNGYPIQEIPGRPNLIFFVDNTGKQMFLGNTMSSPEDQELYYTTDFWGEYTLAKK
jgi:hypothetical protein